MTSGSGDRPRKEGCHGGGVYSFFPGLSLSILALLGLRSLPWPSRILVACNLGPWATPKPCHNKPRQSHPHVLPQAIFLFEGIRGISESGLRTPRPAVRGLSGPLGPKCTRDCPRASPRKPGCPRICDTPGTLSGTLLDTPGARDPNGPKRHSVGTPLNTPVLGDTLGDTSGPEGRKTPVAGRGVHKARNVQSLVLKCKMGVQGENFCCILGAVGRQPPPANPFSKPLT